MVGVDAEQTERERGIQPLFVRPLRAGEGVRHILDRNARLRRHSSEDGRGTRIVYALAHVPDGRLILPEDGTQPRARLFERGQTAIAELQQGE